MGPSACVLTTKPGQPRGQKGRARLPKAERGAALLPFCIRQIKMRSVSRLRRCSCLARRRRYSAATGEAPASVLYPPLQIPDDPDDGARSINAAIVGIPNAGKSVLLNLLVNSQVRRDLFVRYDDIELIRAPFRLGVDLGRVTEGQHDT